MSYRCDGCSEVHWGKENKHVNLIRKVSYLKFIKSTDKRSDEDYYSDTSHGTEIVQEIHLCDKCFEGYKNKSPDVVDKDKTVKYFAKKNKKEYLAEQDLYSQEQD